MAPTSPSSPFVLATLYFFFVTCTHASSLCPIGRRYECTECPVGQFSTAASSSAGPLNCTPCPGGKFASSAGAGSCATCVTGQISYAGSSMCFANEACTGSSTKLPADQCNAWIKLHDDTGGASWTKCAGYRTDPCACKGSDEIYGSVCSGGTSILRM